MDKRLKGLLDRIVFIRLNSGAEIIANVAFYSSAEMMDTDYDSVDVKLLEVIKD